MFWNKTSAVFFDKRTVAHSSCFLSIAVPFCESKIYLLPGLCSLNLYKIINSIEELYLGIMRLNVAKCKGPGKTENEQKNLKYDWQTLPFLRALK